MRRTRLQRRQVRNGCVYMIVCAELACWLVSQRVRGLVNLQQGDPKSVDPATSCPCQLISSHTVCADQVVYQGPTLLLPQLPGADSQQLSYLTCCRGGGVQGGGAAAAPRLGGGGARLAVAWGLH